MKFIVKLVIVNYPEVADPGFSSGGANPEGEPGYDLIKISRKLHEIKEISTGGGHPLRPLRSATEFRLIFISQLSTYPKIGNTNFRCTL